MKRPTIEKHNIDTLLPGAPSPIWRLIMPRPPPTRTTHTHIYTHTLPLLGNLDSFNLKRTRLPPPTTTSTHTLWAMSGKWGGHRNSISSFTAQKLEQAADRSIYVIDTMTRSLGMHILVTDCHLTQPFSSLICSHVCNAGGGFGTIFPLGFPAWWQRCAHHSPLCPQSSRCHGVLIGLWKIALVENILPTGPIKCAVDLYRGLMMLYACCTVQPYISNTN